MTQTNSPKNKNRILVLGILTGFVLATGAMLASGYMIAATNKDTFCVSCHAMKPFRSAWKNSKHGMRNAKGLAAQCTDCHLPHDGLINYVTTKAYTGARDIINNLIIDPYEYDWVRRAEARREFTYDSSCRACHQNLTPQGMRTAGILAHREYLLGDLDKRCVDCHKHVGHKNLKTEVRNYFGG
ncbi:NapC/NirT family cytochrome c [Maridesulfovibrio sp.]|uniref:cytochrome c3 family protein n=1 Tax=Maridesulfovibrio sp. TaxID=2795000 RepID=UPI002A187BC8|nr:NapC/NirT family cytochrome c [Maridesulfovibrio sp.]